jgi:hypothetical protein
MPAGRPFKEGLDYFQIDTDLEADVRIVQLRIKHPEKGLEVYLLMLTRIYRDLGYFIEWNPVQCRNMAPVFLTTKEKTQAIIDTCVEEGLFDPGLYKQYNILTSGSIQDRFLRSVYRRKRIYIIREFSLFSHDLIEYLKLHKSAYYRIYDDIGALFVNGFLIAHWQKFARFELISEALGMVAQKVEVPGEVEAPSTEPVEPASLNGKHYGDPTPLPPTFDWEKEKELLTKDEEWMFLAAQKFNIGKWDGRNFIPDHTALLNWLLDFFEWCAISGKKQTAQGMKSHFTNWYPKRESFLAQVPKDKRKSPLHVGTQDYDSMTKW